MHTLRVQASSHDYDVMVGKGLRHEAGRLLSSSYRHVFIISDSNASKLYTDEVKAAFSEDIKVNDFVVPAGEQSKSMDMYAKLQDYCFQIGLDRHSVIIALGGGMIGDLAGFVAATYMRGVDFVQMPTTILAHDSSVGGKVAINHPESKNMIGSFYNPVQVIYDIDTLNTLPAQEKRSGYAEIVKHGCLDDPALFHELLACDIAKISPEQMEIHLLKGIEIKANIVEKDEKEAGIRKYLNFGHTLGHAVESHLGYGEITHGEAVAAGMLFAMYISQSVLEADLPIMAFRDWLRNNDYPIDRAFEIKAEKLLERMKKDKKAINESIHFVLLKRLGEVTVEPIADKDLVSFINRFKREVLDQ
ncbi:3-dehydroquinate synthase [Thalassobacillus sp. CUG 92003]|uniref:3-dehydroquinate synthase n=1 Tax=Thalassobacillus sp. CUG 92003 TaxID=2736641 RepID=UPI0015E78F72|nr:3-dehydroquinate synthase [Thalassobacillus sp. CUG 92003]